MSTGTVCERVPVVPEFIFQGKLHIPVGLHMELARPIPRPVAFCQLIVIVSFADAALALMAARKATTPFKWRNKIFTF